MTTDEAYDYCIQDSAGVFYSPISTVGGDFFLVLLSNLYTEIPCLLVSFSEGAGACFVCSGEFPK